MSRIVSLLVPLFPLAARLRSEPELRDDAVVIVEGSGNNAHVIAATRRARTKGIQAGLSLTQARAILPKLVARGRDRECERTAQEALLEVAETFSPRVEDSDEGLVFFDISGMERHFKDDRELAMAAMRAADAVGLPARCGVASSKLAARIAAELPKSPVIVPRDGEAEFLAPLPLARLAPALDVAATLQRWGLGSIGELAGLAESEVASRLGELGRELHHAARGIDPRPLIPRALPPEFREGMELEWPLVELEPFLFIASSALDRLTARLEAQGFACVRLELTMTLEPDGYHSRAIILPAPTRDAKTMLTLLRLDLEKNPPGAPVIGFSIVAHPDRPRRAQLSLFGPAALSPEKLATTIAKLISILGVGSVGMPMTVDGHLPERYAMGVFDPPPPPDVRRQPRKSRGLLAARILRPPVPVRVTTRIGKNGDTQIAAIHSETELSGNVRVSSGPWHIEEGWWKEAPEAREYWDIELVRGGIYRLYRNKSEEWFIDSEYG
ncbi:MAG: DNA polymerase Y family protein [Acidobacteria bacterium]|nr:DNA polymerase Y family protein [Acidobacteriota bacterium]